MASPISKEEPHHERGSGKPYSGVPLLIMQGGFLLLIVYIFSIQIITQNRLISKNYCANKTKSALLERLY